MKKFSILLAACCVFSTPVFAHVTANPNEGIAGKYFETAFRVSHGCDGSDTTAVTIKIPAGIVSIKPQHKPGWTIEIKKSKLDKPVPAGHGKMAIEQFDEITWKGGPLPDSEYDTFGLLFKLPAAPGMLWFPVTQICEKGTEEWKNVPAKMDKWHDTDHPAPFVKITPAPSAGGHQH